MNRFVQIVTCGQLRQVKGGLWATDLWATDLWATPLLACGQLSVSKGATWFTEVRQNMNTI